MKQHLLNATLGTLLTGTLALSAAAEGPETVWGSASITIQNGQTVITASDGTVLDWQSLMVAPWETLEFNLPDGESAILNRVLGGTPTDIQGSLLSNGHVYIVNPAGVVFGADAVVDCGALYAVAGNVSLDDWMQGLDRFELTGEVTNHGHLQGNKVALLGQRVLNHGTVQAGNGLVALVAGDEVLLWESGGRLHAKIDGELLANTAGTGQAASDLSGLAAVENTGSIQGGSVLFGAGDAFALALNNQGLVQANTAEFSAVGGGVVLGGMIEGQTIEANGPVVVLDGALSSNGGLVSLDASTFLQLASGSSVDVSNQGGAAGAFMASTEGSLVIAPDAQINASGDVGGLVDLSGDSAFFSGDIDVEGEHMDGLLMLGGGVLGADILIVDDIPNEDVNNLSLDFNGSVGLDNPALIPGTNYLVANALINSFGPIRIHTSGDIEVLAELDLTNNFIPELRLHAGQQLTINKAIKINGNLTLMAGGSPSIDDGGQFGLIEINAGLNALGNILIDGVAEGFNPSGDPYQNEVRINTSEWIVAGENLNIADNVFGGNMKLAARQIQFDGKSITGDSLQLNAVLDEDWDESPILFTNESGTNITLSENFGLDIEHDGIGQSSEDPTVGALASFSLHAKNIEFNEVTFTALGDLTLHAEQNLKVKNLNALGNMTLEGSSLTIQLDNSRTVDMISGGDFVANVSTVIQEGDGNFRFAPTTGVQLSPAFRNNVTSNFQIGQPNVNFNSEALGGGTRRLLDATSVELPAQLLPPDEDQLAAQAAQTARAERELGMAENQAFQDAFNISVQTNSLGELGRRLGLVSLDASNVGGGDNRRTSISELRLRPSAARAAVAAHQELMASGSSKILQAAWDRFTADRESVDPTAFRVWLAEADEVLAREGWAAHDRMRAALRLSGLTPSEARAAVQAANANLGVAELSEALQTILGGVRGEEATASAGPVPEAPEA